MAKNIEKLKREIDKSFDPKMENRTKAVAWLYVERKDHKATTLRIVLELLPLRQTRKANREVEVLCRSLTVNADFERGRIKEISHETNLSEKLIPKKDVTRKKGWNFEFKPKISADGVGGVGGGSNNEVTLANAQVGSGSERVKVTGYKLETGAHWTIRILDPEVLRDEQGEQWVTDVLPLYWTKHDGDPLELTVDFGEAKRTNIIVTLYLDPERIKPYFYSRNLKFRLVIRAYIKKRLKPYANQSYLRLTV